MTPDMVVDDPPPPASGVPTSDIEALVALLRSAPPGVAQDEEEVFRLELRVDAAHEGVLLLRVLVVLLLLGGLVLMRGLWLG